MPDPFFDVAIVGAGPAGAAAAVRLAALGITNVTLIERQAWPRKKACASVLTPKAIRMLTALGTWDAVQASAYRLRGVRVMTPRIRSRAA